MRRVLLAALACLAIAGCGDLNEAKEAAEAQVSVFHDQFNDQEFGAIVDSAHPDMLEATPRSELLEVYGAVRRKLGKVTVSRNVNWNVRVFNGVKTVVLVQNTTFEQGEGTETFTYRIEDEAAFLLGYNINSKELIVK